MASDPQHSAILAYLEYGFPINYCAPTPPHTENVNHPSAINHPQHVEAHIQTELSQNAMVGPFKHKPFVQWSHSSPLMSREKKGTSKRRIITDMSWPIRRSVNSSIPRDHNQGKYAKTVLPTLQDILQKVQPVIINGNHGYFASLLPTPGRSLRLATTGDCLGGGKSITPRLRSRLDPDGEHWHVSPHKRQSMTFYTNRGCKLLCI